MLLTRQAAHYRRQGSVQRPRCGDVRA